jgi:uncharacterized SAM-binding protein YcdF (DUF218 family)
MTVDPEPSARVHDRNDPSPRLRWLARMRRHPRRSAALLMLIALLTCPLWLAALGSLLVTRDAIGAAGALMIVDGDGRYARAASLLSSPPMRGGEALVYDARDAWLAQHGLVPSETALAQRELARRGLRAARVHTLHGQNEDPPSLLRALGGYLDAAPDVRVALLVAELHSRSASVWADRLLGPARRARIAIVPLRDRRFDATSFWHSRHGLTTALQAAIELVFARLMPVPAPQPPWDPEAYVRGFVQGSRTLPPLSWPAAWLDVGGPADAVDYAFILPGDLKYRTATAAALVRAGLARAIAVPSTERSDDELDGIAENYATISRKMLAALAITPDRIVVLPSGSKSTFDDLRALRELMRAHADAKVALVTDRLHMRRARFTAQLVLGELSERLVYVSTPSPSLHGDAWWSTASGFTMVSSEYLKLAFYWLRYGSGLWWVVMGALLAGGATSGWRFRKSRRLRARGAGGSTLR